MCVSRRMLRLKALVALLLAKQGPHTGLREVRMLRGREGTLCKAPQPIQIPCRRRTPPGQRFDIEIVPRALSVMAPSAGAA